MRWRNEPSRWHSSSSLWPRREVTGPGPHSQEVWPPGLQGDSPLPPRRAHRSEQPCQVGPPEPPGVQGIGCRSLPDTCSCRLCARPGAMCVRALRLSSCHFPRKELKRKEAEDISYLSHTGRVDRGRGGGRGRTVSRWFHRSPGSLNRSLQFSNLPEDTDHRWLGHTEAPACQAPVNRTPPTPRRTGGPAKPRWQAGDSRHLAGWRTAPLRGPRPAGCRRSGSQISPPRPCWPILGWL